MRKMKYFIFVLLFFMVIGFAAVSVSLSIGGNATVVTDIEDFKVYYSDVKVNDVQDLTLVKSDTELVFDINLYEPGETVVVSYDVTNASKMFDAEVTISCTSGNEYLSVINDYDGNNISARSSEYGTLTFKKLKSNASNDDKNYTITCNIDAVPVERTSEGTGDVSPSKEFINFTIDGVSYRVLKGMYWHDWTYSTFNTDDFRPSGSFIENKDEKQLYNVDADTYIEDGEDYYHSIIFSYIVEDINTGDVYDVSSFNVPNGMTWGEFTVSSLNNIGLYIQDGYLYNAEGYNLNVTSGDAIVDQQELLYYVERG